MSDSEVQIPTSGRGRNPFQVINSHTKGEYLDDKKYWVIFERAHKLNVPIYLHPRGPSPDMMKPFIGYPMLDSAMWGFSAEAGLHSFDYPMENAEGAVSFINKAPIREQDKEKICHINAERVFTL